MLAPLRHVKLTITLSFLYTNPPNDWPTLTFSPTFKLNLKFSGASNTKTTVEPNLKPPIS